MLFHQHRRLTDGELWFSRTRASRRRLSATVKARGKSCRKLDLLTGRTSPYPANLAGRIFGFPVALPPAGSLLLVAKDVPGPAAPLRVAAGQAVESRSPLTSHARLRMPSAID